MSARVVNRLAFTEFRQVRSPIKLRRPKSPSAIAKDRIKRDLFGPINRDESRRFLYVELLKQQKQAEQKWGFDFVAGLPSSGTNQYLWERVPPTFVPEMYTLSRAAHVRGEVSCDDEAADRLMDVRAAAIFKQPSSRTIEIVSSSSGSKTKRVLQPKITDYLQERKRPSVNSIKRLQSTSPAKKLRRTLSLCETSTVKKQHTS